MTGSAELGLARRKARDRSIALVLAGTALLMPPLIGVSLVDGRIAGMPVPLLYVSVVWAALIAVAALLARPLRDSETTASSGATSSSGTAALSGTPASSGNASDAAG